jgi:aryl-alcohol dehydrogenase-like predicted oxidoreductase
MEHRLIPATSSPVSAIGLGCWQLGAEWGRVSDEEAQRILRGALDAGITFFDTADVYGAGRSERRIGRFLRETGSRPFVATKLGRFPEPGWPWNFRPATIRRHVEASCARLGVEALDLVQLHCVPTEVLERGEAFETLRRLRDEGRIRAFGASVETFRQAELCLREPDCASLQVIFNLFRQEPREALFERCRRQGVALIVRLPLSSGLLSGRMTAATRFAADDHRSFNRDGAAFHVGETFTGLPLQEGLALVDELRAIAPAGVDLAAFAQRWILDHPAVTTVITGATRPAQVRTNAGVADLPPLPRALHARLAAWQRERVRPHLRGHG